MPQIIIELDDAHYWRYKYIAGTLEKTVEEYAKQQIENIADTFYEPVKEMNSSKDCNLVME